MEYQNSYLKIGFKYFLKDEVWGNLKSFSNFSLMTLNYLAIFSSWILILFSFTISPGVYLFFISKFVIDTFNIKHPTFPVFSQGYAIFFLSIAALWLGIYAYFLLRHIYFLGVKNSKTPCTQTVFCKPCEKFLIWLHWID